jgi:hypothetical protein
VDGAVPGRGGDDDGSGGGRGGGSVVPGAAVKAEEEWDGDGGEGEGAGGMARFPGAAVKAGRTAAMAWTQRRQRRCRRGRRQRGCMKFWQLEDVQVKILRLGFEDRVAGSFIGGLQ